MNIESDRTDQDKFDMMRDPMESVRTGDDFEEGSSKVSDFNQTQENGGFDDVLKRINDNAYAQLKPLSARQ